MKKLISIITLSVLFCLAGCTDNRQSVADAYDKRDSINLALEEDSSKVQNETTEEQVILQTVEAYKTSAESYVVDTYDRIEYAGIVFQIKDAVKTNSIDGLYEIMEKEDADAFKEQLINGYGEEAGYVTKEGKPKSEWDEFFLIKCEIENTIIQDKRISIELPLYYVDKNVDINDLQNGKSLDSSLFNLSGACVDFYGEHYKYVDPRIGMETTDCNQYFMLKAGAVEELVLVFTADTLYQGMDKKWYISSYFLGGNQNNNELYLPDGTYLIELPEE